MFEEIGSDDIKYRNKIDLIDLYFRNWNILGFSFYFLYDRNLNLNSHTQVYFENPRNWTDAL